MVPYLRINLNVVDFSKIFKLQTICQTWLLRYVDHSIDKQTEREKFVVTNLLLFGLTGKKKHSWYYFKVQSASKYWTAEWLKY